MGTWQLFSLHELEGVARSLLAAYPDKRIFAFYGEMGAGKTTFIKAICRVLGVRENVSSPTFSLVNEYETENGKVVYHFDFYRIEKEQEALDIGVLEYFSGGAYCLIEWPEKILHLLPEESVSVRITVKNETRIITTKDD